MGDFATLHKHKVSSLSPTQIANTHKHIILLVTMRFVILSGLSMLWFLGQHSIIRVILPQRHRSHTHTHTHARKDQHLPLETRSAQRPQQLLIILLSHTLLSTSTHNTQTTEHNSKVLKKSLYYTNLSRQTQSFGVVSYSM